MKQTEIYRLVIYSAAAVVCGYFVGWWMAIVDDNETFAESLLKMRILAITCYLIGILLFQLLSKVLSFLFLLPKGTLSLFIPDSVGIAFCGSSILVLYAHVLPDLSSGLPYYMPIRWFGLASFYSVFTLPIMALAQLSVFLYQHKSNTKKIR